jgi:hypothetical protein
VSGLTGVPQYLDVNASYVYFDEVSGGTIKRVPIAGGSVTTLATGQTSPQGLVLGSTNVYWVGGTTGTTSPLGYVAWMPLNGGTVTSITAALATLPAEVVVSGSQQPYWTAQGSSLASGGVFTYAGSDGSLSGASTVASEPNALGLAADSAYLYFSIFPAGAVKPPGPPPPGTSSSGISSSSGVTSSSGIISSSSGGTSCVGCASVASVPIGGGGVFTIASGLNAPMMVAVDSTSVYWADGPSGTIMQAPGTGNHTSTPVTLASGQSTPLPIRSDGKYVYWGNAGGGQLMAVPPGGGAPVTLATGQPNIRDIALSSACIYWTTAQSNTVMKIGKP